MQRSLEVLAVVDPGTDDHLGVHLDAGAQEFPQPAQTGRAAGVAQHLGAQFGVRGVDRDVERREPLVDHPLQVELGEARSVV